MSKRWIISCEHGGNAIPPAYAALFSGAQEVLASHRGWDPGALLLFEQLQPLADFAYSATTSRLLVELNRSLHHPALFSAFSKELSQEAKQSLLRQYYHPYRQKVEEAIAQFISEGAEVLHLSIHSFTPVLDGQQRNADIGLLYDPTRREEKAFCSAWKKVLQKKLPGKRVRFNYPYKGTADGFTTYLRKMHPKNYAGIEFELNQLWANDKAIYDQIYQSLLEMRTISG